MLAGLLRTLEAANSAAGSATEMLRELLNVFADPAAGNS
jgi:hypothetical protein